MAEYYLALRHAHIGFVILSIGLFVLRGGLMLVDSRQMQSGWLRYPFRRLHLAPSAGHFCQPGHLTGIPGTAPPGGSPSTSHHGIMPSGESLLCQPPRLPHTGAQENEPERH